VNTLSACVRVAFVVGAFAGVTLPVACDCGGGSAEGEGEATVGDGFIGVVVVDDDSVVVRFAEPVNASSFDGAFVVGDFTVVPPASVSVSVDAGAADEAVLTASTPFIAGTRYTVVVDGVQTKSGRALSGTLNFTARAGALVGTTVKVVVDDVETARRHGSLTALATVAADGSFSESMVAWPLVDEGDVFAATLPVFVDPSRTIDTGDDADVAADHRALAVLLVDDAGRMASALTPFVVGSASPADVVVDVLPPLEIVDQP
jgi:hypothetical protein